MDGTNAIPVKVNPQIVLRNFLRTACPAGTDLGVGLEIGTYYCHFGELLKRKEGDPEISNVGITNEDFESKMTKLLLDAPAEIVNFISTLI